MGNGAKAMSQEILFSDLPTLCGGNFSGDPSDTAIRWLSFDSRKSFPGDGAVYFAIKGPNHDGHSFIDEAYAKGWRLFVVEILPNNYNSLQGASFFAAQNAIHVVQRLAALRRATFSVPVVGITGSNAKTIVKEFLYQLIVPSLAVIKSPKSWNSQIGVPLSVWPMSDYHQAGIFEAGISQPGEMEVLESIIQPTIGIITNIGSAHDAFFPSIEEKLEEKMKLFKQCQRLIYCSDHELIDDYLHRETLPGVKRVSWGREGSPSYKVQVNGDRLLLEWLTESLEVVLPFRDEKSIENLCHSIVVALELGVEKSEVARQVPTMSTLPMRLALKDGVFGSLLIDDSYNNDYLGLEAALDFAITHSHGKPLTVVLSDILQANSDDAALYGRVAETLKNKAVGKLYLVGQVISAHKTLFDIPTKTFHSTEQFLASVETKEFASQTILIKGARTFRFERIVERFQSKVHRTVLEINLEALQHNFQFYRSLLSPKTKKMVMLKAFAYGSGGGEIGRTLQYLKADYVAVAYPDEGVLLRQQGVYLPIMVMNAPEESFSKMQEYSLEPEIFCLSQLIAYADWSLEKENIPPIHIELDSGMHRLGFSYGEIDNAAKLLRDRTDIRIASVFSHLAASDNAALDSFTMEQANTFLALFEQLVAKLPYKPFRHLLNTAGISRFPEYHFDMVRMGIGLHGVESTREEQGQLTVVATLKTVVSQVKSVNRGETVSYGRSGKIIRPTEVATIAVGYADGYSRSFGNGNGKVLIHGHLAPTIGNVCMDMTMIDVTGLDVKEGDEVIVFGEKPTVKDLAEWSQTIPYEILTSISDRVKREYLSF